MRLIANSIPKSGTHLLDRLLILLGYDWIDFGGVSPRRVEDGRSSSAQQRLRSSLGLRKVENVMGIGSHLVSGGRFPRAREALRARGPEKVTVGVDFPEQIGRRWLGRRLEKVSEGCFVTAHCVYSPELAGLFREKGLETVCILRDPRDVAVSQMHYIKKLKGHPIHEAFVALPSDHERLLFSIRGGHLGGREMLSLDERYRRFSGWAEDGGAVVVRFEDLVGPEGGGSAESQRRAVERVAAHVGAKADEGALRKVEENLFGSGKTFRKGQIGGWREEFGPEHEQAATEVAGRLLVELGYETDPSLGRPC